VKIHDRYILRSFLRNILIGILAFLIIYVTVDVNEKIDDYIDNNAFFMDVAGYYLFLIPWIVLLVTPVAVLLATIFTLGKLSRQNELTALISSGVSLVRTAAPVLIASLVISFLVMAFGEFVVPLSNRRAERIKLVRIEKSKEKYSKRFKEGLHYQGEENRVYYAEKYDIKLKMMFNVVLQEYNGSSLVRRIDAKKAIWDGACWVFLDGAVREFRNNVEKVTPFKKIKMPELKEKPEDFAKEDIDPEEMNYRELKDYIDKIRRAGGPVEKYLVDLYFKFSFPFTSLIFAVIGTALSSAKRKPTIATGFGLTLVISFTYYGILRIGQALGHSGVIQPLLGAWIGNIIFLIVGGILLHRANR